MKHAFCAIFIFQTRSRQDYAQETMQVQRNRKIQKENALLKSTLFCGSMQR